MIPFPPKTLSLAVRFALAEMANGPQARYYRPRFKCSFGLYVAR